MKTSPVFFARKAAPTPETSLLADGYERRTTAIEPRLSEIVAEYRRIGFEVEVIEHRTEGDACGVCYDAAAQAGNTYGDVYVRAPRDRRG